ncbi:MAG TPA: hypothetical protein VMK12_09555 [Anaeromyxobacteraceae bacterium]|nr:hypothetical protein [Anaeromyxobacteraceae bacterium]
MLSVTIALSFALGAAGPEIPAWDPRDEGPSAIDVSSYPPEQQQRYRLFGVKCSKCHPVSRAVNSDFDATEWKRYMKKMIRRPNSGANEEQSAEIYEFLKEYAARGGPRSLRRTAR